MRIIISESIGSTTMVVDPSINRIDWYMYDAYGVTDVLRQNQYTPYKFGGKHGYYSDGDSGMILLGHRYYMPDLGKFLTQDPKGHEAGLNLYQYASENPLVNIDPNGTDAADAREALRSFRTDIASMARATHIQPELLAGVVWVEMYAGGVHGWNAQNRAISQFKFAEIGKASLGMTQVTKIAKNCLGCETYEGRVKFAHDYDLNPYAQLFDSASLLRHLASRANRYPGRQDHLTDKEMAVVLTEYNIGERPSPANKAQPGPYGRTFLRALPEIRQILQGK